MAVLGQRRAPSCVETRRAELGHWLATRGRPAVRALEPARWASSSWRSTASASTPRSSPCSATTGATRSAVLAVGRPACRGRPGRRPRTSLTTVAGHEGQQHAVGLGAAGVVVAAGVAQPGRGRRVAELAAPVEAVVDEDVVHEEVGRAIRRDPDRHRPPEPRPAAASPARTAGRRRRGRSTPGRGRSSQRKAAHRRGVVAAMPSEREPVHHPPVGDVADALHHGERPDHEDDRVHVGTRSRRPRWSQVSITRVSRAKA